MANGFTASAVNLLGDSATSSALTMVEAVKGKFYIQSSSSLQSLSASVPPSSVDKKNL